MPLTMPPDDPNGVVEQEDDNKVSKRVPTTRQTGLVNEPVATSRRTANKMYGNGNPNISSRAGASSQQQIPSSSRLTTQVPRRNNKETSAPPVPSDRL
jgi:hypothetical protein